MSKDHWLMVLRNFPKGECKNMPRINEYCKIFNSKIDIFETFDDIEHILIFALVPIDIFLNSKFEKHIDKVLSNKIYNTEKSMKLLEKLIIRFGVIDGSFINRPSIIKLIKSGKYDIKSLFRIKQIDHNFLMKHCAADYMIWHSRPSIHINEFYIKYIETFDKDDWKSTGTFRNSSQSTKRIIKIINCGYSNF